MRRLIRFLIVVFCTLQISCTKDIVDTTGNLVGVISDSRTGSFLSGVSVSTSPLGKTFTTGVDGKYEFRNLESQEYSISVSKNGYNPDKKTVFVQVGEDTNLDFQITPSTGTLFVSQNELDFGNEVTKSSLDISNNGNALLSWQISEDASWLSCNPTSGATQPGEKTSIVVTVDRTGLTRGSYSQNLTITSDGGSAVVNIRMAVQGITISVSPEELDFGPVTTSMQLSITNTGSGNIAYTMTPSNSWIQVSKTSGTFSKTEVVTVSVNRNNLSEGNHEGKLALTIGEEKIDIPVRMSIPSKEKPTVSMQTVENVSYNSAVFRGGLVSVGSSKVTNHGFCWSEQEQPTISSNGICNLGDSETAKDFTYNATSLKASSTYYVRAYAENSVGVSYSNQIKFQTNGVPQVAEVETGSATDVTSSKALVSGNIVNLGNTGGLSQYGHVWGTMENPTISNDKTQLGKTTSTGAYNSTLTGLSPNTLYHVRAYATNEIGTSYGKDITFTTSLADVVLSTGSVNNITHKTATCQGEITSTGGNTIQERGFCWGTASAPTVSDNTIVANTVSNSFSANLSGLKESTIYHVRAYAKTSTGKVFYGNDVAFSTTAQGVKITKEGYEDDTNWTK